MIKLPKDVVLYLDDPGLDRFWDSDDGMRIYDEEVIPFGVMAGDEPIFISPNKRLFTGVVKIYHRGEWLSCSFKKAKIKKESIKTILEHIRNSKPKPIARVVRADEVLDYPEIYAESPRPRYSYFDWGLIHPRTIRELRAAPPAELDLAELERRIYGSLEDGGFDY